MPDTFQNQNSTTIMGGSTEMRRKVLPQKRKWTVQARGPERSPSKGCCRYSGRAASRLLLAQAPRPSPPFQHSCHAKGPHASPEPQGLPALSTAPSLLRTPWDVRQGDMSTRFLFNKWLGCLTNPFPAFWKDCQLGSAQKLLPALVHNTPRHTHFFNVAGILFHCNFFHCTFKTKERFNI